MTHTTRDLIPAFLNPAAGNADASQRALRAAGGFDIHEVPPDALATSVRAAADAGAKRVLVAGGDGSIGAAAAVLANRDTELAILPSGTLNHLAKDLGVPLNLEHAARVALESTAAIADAGFINHRLFVNTSSVGAYVTFVRLRERLERRIGYGLASFIATLRLLYRLPVFRVTLEVDGAAREYLTPLVFVGVGERELKLPTLGARVPHGRPGLHVMIIRRRSGARTLALALAAAARGVRAVAQTPAMDVFLVESLRIETPSKRAAVDGELVAVASPLDYRHSPGCLRIVAP
ncbi:MAG TPA: diacylglycerol kinase family protein [Gemmatimonadaceae bacterium]